MNFSKKLSCANHKEIYPEPFAFFHEIPSCGLCVSIDCRQYGNIGRFIRRSCLPNATIKHTLSKGAVHVYVVTTRNIEANEEITIPHERDTFATSSTFVVAGPPLPCANCSNGSAGIVGDSEVKEQVEGSQNIGMNTSSVTPGPSDLKKKNGIINYPNPDHLAE